MKLGRNLARTFLDYYKLQNLIIFNPTTAIAPKNVNYIKTSNTSQNLSSFNVNNTVSPTASATNPVGSTSTTTPTNTNNINNGSNSASTCKDSSSSIASVKPASTTRMSKNINQTLKPLSSLSLGGNSSSSLSNVKDDTASNGKTVMPQSATSTDSTAATTGVTFSLG